MHILYEDNHLLVVVKPAGLVTQGAAEDEESLVTQAKAYLKQKCQKPGNVYVGVVSRLDAPVSGVTILARTSKAADRLTKTFRDREASKLYWALVSGSPPPQGELRDWLVKDERQQRVIITSPTTAGAKEAVLRYRTLGKSEAGTWLEVELITGRKHQIRVQLGARRWPILGDTKYGSHASFPDGIALHARRLELEHPVLKTPLVFEAPLPRSWQRFNVG
jgi:23S rRNA pseudouridine1911/1915/1917 synthase